MKKLLCLIAFFTSMSVSAQTVLEADAYLDVTTGKLIKNAVIVVDGERITALGSKGKVEIPEDAEIVDLSGHTLLPGLFDMHVHLTSDASIHGYRRLNASLPRTTLRGVKAAKSTLMAGFTTVRNVGAPGFADVALRDAINDGDFQGPRMFVAGRSIGVTGGHCDNNLLPPDYDDVAGGVADGPWAVREKVRENIKYGATVIKFCATGGVLSKGTKVGAQQYTFEEMKALIDEAHMRGLTVAAHAHGLEGIKTAIKAGVDSVEHASFLNEEAIALAVENGTYLSMDVYVTEYILGEGEEAGILPESLEKERVVGTTQRNSFRNAVEAGANMVFGSDAGVYPHGDNGKQFARMVDHGMTPLQAIQAATINSATLLKQQSELGSLASGKFADIIAVKSSPLDDIKQLENIQFVMKAGEIYKPAQMD